MPKVVRLSYDFVSSAESSQPKLVDRLAQLAKTEFTEIVKPKTVSEFVGLGLLGLIKQLAIRCEFTDIVKLKMVSGFVGLGLLGWVKQLAKMWVYWQSQT